MAEEYKEKLTHRHLGTLARDMVSVIRVLLTFLYLNFNPFS